MDEVDDILRRGAGEKNLGDAGFFQAGDVGFRNDASDKDGDIGHPFFVKEIHELRANGVMRAGED